MVIAIDLVRSLWLTRATQSDAAWWLVCGGIVFFLSGELQILSNYIFFQPDNYNRISDVFVRVGYPILWGLCSFVLMWLGMKFKFRVFRIVALTLFGVTLVKLFVYDISNIPVGGKIAAFCCLGVLLLVISFMYQRLKRIIQMENDTIKQNTDDHI